MRILFVMDPMSAIDPDKDTTFAIERALQRRGHRCYHCVARDLYVIEGDVWASARRLSVSAQQPRFTLGRAEDVRLADLGCVFIRKDPPFDEEYLYATLLLERVRGRALMVNDPRGLREANEKLYALHFSRHMPRTLVTADRERMVRFIAEVGPAVVKPLNGAGGKGVMLVSTSDKNTRSIVDSITDEGCRHAMVQEYLPEVACGDKRVLLLAGRILGAINRLARSDDIRSNIHVGGRVEPSEVSDAEMAIVADMVPRLAEDGLVLVGLDFIGGRLTEVNVTSPTGVQELSLHLGRDVADQIVDWIERATQSYQPLAGTIPPG